MKYHLKKYFAFVLIISIVFILGCSPKISKTAFTNHMLGMDYYHFMLENHKTCEKWDNCFDISKSEADISINQIFDTCINQESESLPDMLGYSDRMSFGKSIDICAIDTFFKKYRDDFTFDKTPECIEQCKKVRIEIKKLRK